MTKTFNLKTQDPSAVMVFFREKSGLTKTEICKRLNISRPTLNKNERRPKDIAVKYLDKLQDLYGEDFIEYYMDNEIYR